MVKDTSEAVREHEAQCDQLVIDMYLRALTEGSMASCLNHIM